MKYKKVNTGFESPDGTMKPEDYHVVSPEMLQLYTRQHSDPCAGMLEPSKPLDLATSPKYPPYYTVPSSTAAPVTHSLVDFTYQTQYYNPIQHTGAGLDLRGIQDTLNMPTQPTSHGIQHHHKYGINNNSVQYHSQYNTQYYP